MSNCRVITLPLILTGIIQSHQSNMSLFRGDLTLHIALILVKKEEEEEEDATVHACIVKFTRFVMNQVVRPRVFFFFFLQFMSCNIKVSGLTAILGVLCSNKSIQRLLCFEGSTFMLQPNVSTSQKLVWRSLYSQWIKETHYMTQSFIPCLNHTSFSQIQ